MKLIDMVKVRMHTLVIFVCLLIKEQQDKQKEDSIESIIPSVLVKVRKDRSWWVCERKTDRCDKHKNINRNTIRKEFVYA